MDQPSPAMNLAQFGEVLKKQRLEKHISLMDISVETRINVRFLEAIEAGDFHVLPQTYVRAFLREYAAFVGMNPDEVMQMYTAARGEARPAAAPAPAAAAPTRPQSDETSPPLTQRFTASQKRLALIGFLVVAAAVIVILSRSNRDITGPQPVPEISFDRVVRESAAAVAVRDSTPVDTLPKPRAVDDSLRLQISTTDSVWISLLIDGKTSESYLFGPNRKRVWAAEDKFQITMGNAGGATFTLNGKDIGVLGKRGAVLRNAAITRELLNAH